jgi:ABC-2 type transport system permease protein
MFRLSFILIRASIRSQMQYKLHFLATAATTGVLMALDFLILSAILYRFNDVQGWGIYEVGMLYGISSAAFSLYRMFAPEIHEFERYVIQGEFDQLLLRPVSPLVLLLTRNLELGRLGGVAQGVAILAVSLFGLDGQGMQTWLIMLYLPVALATGVAIFFSISLCTATVAFWSGQVKELQTFTLYAPQNAASYPVSLYPGWLKVLFYSVLPVAFINYLPMVYLLAKGGEWFHLLLPPLVAAVFLLVSLRFWNAGIRHYHSTGS